MADTGVNDILNGYFDRLKVSVGTTDVNTLHAMCLMPLLNDILGGKMTDIASKDKSFWQKFIDKCFPNLRFSKDSNCMNTMLYAGTSVSALPSAEDIPLQGLSYDVSTGIKMLTPRITGNYFWIAVPDGLALSKVNNTDFAGDLIPASGFKRENITIHNGQYSLYWLKSKIPFKSTYQIILK